MINYLFSITLILIIILISLTWRILQKHNEHLVINAYTTIRFHYTDWCAFCKIMKPVWDRVKKNVNNVVFEEINEDIAKSEGIYKYPTILKITKYGKVIEYQGTADYAKLYDFVIS